MCAKVGLGEGDGEGRVGREVELRVAFSPVSRKSLDGSLWGGGGGVWVLDNGNIHRRRRTGAIDLLICHRGLDSPESQLFRNCQGNQSSSFASSLSSLKAGTCGCRRDRRLRLQKVSSDRKRLSQTCLP